MKNDYISVFATHISSFVANKRAIGYKFETAEFYLHDFDNYCCSHGEYKHLSRNLVLGWAENKDGEKPRTHISRISPVREFGKYLQAIGIHDAFVLPTGLCRKVERYVPHFFTFCEITSFFNACDNLKPNKAIPARHLVIPVFYRLLYCCGLRTCEARMLKVEDIDLEKGHIDIIHSKGFKDRRIPLLQDILELFRIYNIRVSDIFPSRIYFFPTTRKSCYCCSSISMTFRKIWEIACLGQGYGNKPRAYDFRHHFALTNLNKWIADGVNVDSMLPYLSRYMGHSCLESTDYYLHLVPEFFNTFSEKVRGSENLLPEVDYNE